MVRAPLDVPLPRTSAATHQYNLQFTANAFLRDKDVLGRNRRHTGNVPWCSGARDLLDASVWPRNHRPPLRQRPPTKSTGRAGGSPCPRRCVPPPTCRSRGHRAALNQAPQCPPCGFPRLSVATWAGLTSPEELRQHRVRGPPRPTARWTRLARTWARIPSWARRTLHTEPYLDNNNATARRAIFPAPRLSNSPPLRVRTPLSVTMESAGRRTYPTEGSTIRWSTNPTPSSSRRPR